MSEYWTTQTGERVDIMDMSDRHVRNTYDMLKRGLTYTLKWINLFESEMDRRGIAYRTISPTEQAPMLGGDRRKVS